MNTPKEPTPRTDEAAFRTRFFHQQEWVSASFARRLETELAAANAAIAAKDAALRQIFEWWDLNDGHLVTHYCLHRSMESLRAALALTPAQAADQLTAAREEQ